MDLRLSRIVKNKNESVVSSESDFLSNTIRRTIINSNSILNSSAISDESGSRSAFKPFSRNSFDKSNIYASTPGSQKLISISTSSSIISKLSKTL